MQTSRRPQWASAGARHRRPPTPRVSCSLTTLFDSWSGMRCCTTSRRRASLREVVRVLPGGRAAPASHSPPATATLAHCPLTWRAATNYQAAWPERPVPTTRRASMSPRGAAVLRPWSTWHTPRPRTCSGRAQRGCSRGPNRHRGVHRGDAAAAARLRHGAARAAGLGPLPPSPAGRLAGWTPTSGMVPKGWLLQRDDYRGCAVLTSGFTQVSRSPPPTSAICGQNRVRLRWPRSVLEHRCHFPLPTPRGCARFGDRAPWLVEHHAASRRAAGKLGERCVRSWGVNIHR